MLVDGKVIGSMKDAPQYEAFLEWLVQRGKMNYVERDRVLHMGEKNDAVSKENYNQFAIERGLSQIVG